MASTARRTAAQEAPPPIIVQQPTDEVQNTPTESQQPPSPEEKRRKAPAGTLQPFWEQIAAYSIEAWERLTAYVYRLQPITDRLTGGNQAKYITKYSSRFDPHTVKHEHGSGKYQIRLNEERTDGTGSRTIRTHEFEIEDPLFPPNVPLGEWVDDARNNKWAWAKETLEARDKEKKVANDAKLAATGSNPLQFAQAVKEMIQLVRPNDNQAAGDKTVSAVIEAMKQSHSEAFHMFQAQQSSSDPSKMLELVTNVLEKLVPKKPDGADPFLNHVLEEMRELRKENSGLMARIMDMNAKPPPDALSQLGTLADTLEKVDGVLGTFRKSTPRFNWAEIGLKSIEILGERVLPAIIPAILNRNTHPPPPGPRAQPQPFSLPAAAGTATDPAQNQAQNPAAAPAGEQTPADGTKENDEAAMSYQYYRQMMLALVQPLLRHLDRGMTGLDFADWFVDGHGAAELEAIRGAGPDQIMLLLRHEKEIWQHLAPFEARLPKFLEEFCSWTPGIDDDDDDPKEELEVPAATNEAAQ